MIHSLFIVNSAGAIVIEKHWRTATSRAVVDFFWGKLQECKRPKDLPPVLTGPKDYLINICRGSLYYVATATQEVTPLSIIELLHRIVDIFEIYFSSSSEDALKQNFATIYQILDEILDNGLPYITEPNALTSLIAPPTLAQKMVSAVTGKSGVSQKFGSGMLTNMPWRTGGVKYANNEIYFDIVEDIDCILDPKGNSITCDVNGRIECQSRLSGTPDLELHLSDPTILDDVSFHPCVRQMPWVKKRVVSFVPPDGKFLLCSYRLANQAQIYPPFYCKKDLHYGTHSGRLEIQVGDRPGSNLQKVGSMKGKALVVEEMKFESPFPSFVKSTDIKVDQGKFHYDEHTKIAIWEVGTIGATSPKLTCIMKLQEIEEGSKRLEKMPLIAHFRVPKCTVSGLGVTNMFLGDSEKYKPFRGVRAVTRAGKYQFRLD